MLSDINSCKATGIKTVNIKIFHRVIRILKNDTNIQDRKNLISLSHFKKSLHRFSVDPNGGILKIIIGIMAVTKREANRTLYKLFNSPIIGGTSQSICFWGILASKAGWYLTKKAAK